MRREAPPPLDPHQPVLYIEYCPLDLAYRKRAEELHATLAEALLTLQPHLHLQLRLNEMETPRVGAFEVTLATTPTEDEGARHLLWTGIKRVPASAKVPHVDDIFVASCAVLKLRHSQAGASRVDLVRTTDKEIKRILRRDKRTDL